MRPASSVAIHGWRQRDANLVNRILAASWTPEGQYAAVG
jgi:hypothetical protein